jgi:hypothetical protein
MLSRSSCGRGLRPRRVDFGLPSFHSRMLCERRSSLGQGACQAPLVPLPPPGMHLASYRPASPTSRNTLPQRLRRRSRKMTRTQCSLVCCRSPSADSRLIPAGGSTAEDLSSAQIPDRSRRQEIHHHRPPRNLASFRFAEDARSQSLDEPDRRQLPPSIACHALHFRPAAILAVAPRRLDARPPAPVPLDAPPAWTAAHRKPAWAGCAWRP